MRPLLASLGINQRHLLIADLLILESVFALLVWAPIAMLYPSVGMPRAALILPFGAIGLALLSWSYANSPADKPQILPKLIVSSWFLAVSWLWIFD